MHHSFQRLEVHHHYCPRSFCVVSYDHYQDYWWYCWLLGRWMLKQDRMRRMEKQTQHLALLMTMSEDGATNGDIGSLYHLQMRIDQGVPLLLLTRTFVRIRSLFSCTPQACEGTEWAKKSMLGSFISSLIERIQGLWNIPWQLHHHSKDQLDLDRWGVVGEMTQRCWISHRALTRFGLWHQDKRYQKLHQCLDGISVNGFKNAMSTFINNQQLDTLINFLRFDESVVPAALENKLI